MIVFNLDGIKVPISTILRTVTRWKWPSCRDLILSNLVPWGYYPTCFRTTYSNPGEYERNSLG